MTEQKTPTKYKLIWGGAALLCLAALAVFIALCLQVPHAVSCDLSALEAKLSAEDPLLVPAEELDLKRNFSLLASDYDEVLYLKSSEFLSVDEVLVIRTSDSGLLDELYTAFTERRTQQMEAFKSYGIWQHARAEAAKIYKNDGYCVYVCSSRPETLLQLIRAAIER